MAYLCFAIMPFGLKHDAKGKEINFDKVYKLLIQPAIVQAGLEPIRADEEKAGGFIHIPMYERLLFCDFAVADLSTANANVLYEVGMRHAIKPFTTVSIYDSGTTLPFDVKPLRALQYNYVNDNIENLDSLVNDLAKLIKYNFDNDPIPDSPLQQTITGFIFPDLTILASQAQSFKEWALLTQNKIDQIIALVAEWKKLGNNLNALLWKTDTPQSAVDDIRLQMKQKVEAIHEFEKTVNENLLSEYNLLNALVKAYRAVDANAYTVSLIEKVPKNTLSKNIFLQQQLAHAYNMTGDLDKAEDTLLKLIDKYGNDPETNGLLGSTYKRKSKLPGISFFQAKGYISKATAAYQSGFDSNPSFYYPGINLVTLLFDSTDNVSKDLFEKYVPLVAYAIDRRIKNKPGDYWANASGLQLEIMRGNENNAYDYLSKALACDCFPWEKKSTCDDLENLYKKNKDKGLPNMPWIETVLQELKK